MEKTIPQIIEDVKEQMCDHYCKYPEQYDNNDKMIEEQCTHCPLCRL